MEVHCRFCKNACLKKQCDLFAAHNDKVTTFYLVFTFCDHDLAGLLSNANVRLSLVHIKTLMKHLLEGLFQIHFAKILHRDMKVSSCKLITKFE